MVKGMPAVQSNQFWREKNNVFNSMFEEHK